MTNEEILRALGAGVERKAIAHVKPGDGKPYLPGWYVIERANRVFGRFGWSSRSSVPELIDKGQDPTEKGPRYRVSFLCNVELTVHLKDGTEIVRTASAVDTAMSYHSIGDASETAVAAATTQALKRCFKSFGPSFGLLLSDKNGKASGLFQDLKEDGKEKGKKDAGGIGVAGDVTIEQLAQKVRDLAKVHHGTNGNCSQYVGEILARYNQREDCIQKIHRIEDLSRAELLAWIDSLSKEMMERIDGEKEATRESGGPGAGLTRGRNESMRKAQKGK
jgi:recombination DNA repair RAD52 pathway protein